MTSLFHCRAGHYLLLLTLGGFVFFLNLGGATLWDVDEGRNSTCAAEMMEAENWIVPTFNAQLRVDKPVLIYWLQIACYRAFGINEFAARFPSALAALATVLLAYELARSMFGQTTGLTAGVILATSPMLCGAARFANPDALLNAFTVATLTIFWFGFRSRPAWWFALLGISTGLAVLAKGPVGVVLPGAVGGLFVLWQRDWRYFWNPRWLVACGAFILTAIPWYIYVGIETKGEFLRGFLLRHNLERGISAMENHHGFPGYYLVVLLAGTMPWSIFLLASWWYGFWSTIAQPWARCQGWWTQASESAISDLETPQQEEKPATEDRVAAYRLLACWIVVYLFFFSVAATKLPNYVLPIVAPCAVLIARFLQRWRTGAVILPSWFWTLSTLALLLIGVGFVVGLSIAGGVGEFAFLRGRYFQGLERWAPLGAIPILGALVGAWFLRQRQAGRFIIALTTTAVLLLAPFAAFGSAIFNRYKAPRPLVEEIAMLGRDHDLRIGGFRVDHLPSLNFYVQRNIEHLGHESEIARFLSYRVPVYLFLPAEEWRRHGAALENSVRVVGRQYDLYHHVELVVVTNQK